MTKQKILITLVLIICAIQGSFADTRRVNLTMNDLTDPSSPSYVPYPYPQTEAEIIGDVKYYIEKFCQPEENPKLLGGQAGFMEVLPNLLEKNSLYKIHSIRKVKHIVNASLTGYDWLVVIVDKKNGYKAASVVVEGTGLVSTCSSPDFSPRKKPLTDEDVLKKISDVQNLPITRKNVKQIEWVANGPYMGFPYSPAWEITLNNGNVYYYLALFDKVYKIKKEYKWGKNGKGLHVAFDSIVPQSEIFSLNEVNDRITTYEEMKKK